MLMFLGKQIAEFIQLSELIAFKMLDDTNPNMYSFDSKASKNLDNKILNSLSLMSNVPSSNKTYEHQIHGCAMGGVAERCDECLYGNCSNTNSEYLSLKKLYSLYKVYLDLLFKACEADNVQLATKHGESLNKIKKAIFEIIEKDLTYDVVLIEKPSCSGLTKDEIIDMANSLGDKSMLPIDIEPYEQECSAMGFITWSAANTLDFDYEESGFREFIASILDDMNNENPSCRYEYKGLNIYLSR
ncbi:MAG: hypothetical protein IJ341_02470 [Bacteroidales bacterium]|nr:hypothetical protein [Bacteroidales bacterium]